jgi:hypothetical protein
MSGRTVILVLLTVVFSILDALVTLSHLERGAKEINPLMGMVIQSDVSIFSGIKGLGIGLATTFLGIHQNFRMGWIALHGLAATYLIVLAYPIPLLLG